jgi:8-amino-7-oxononanoate synthase
MIDLEKKYLEYQKENLLRELNTIDDYKNITDFTSSDYLDLSYSNNLKDSLTKGFDKYGLSSRGSNIVCGYTSATKEFETEFAKFVNYPKAIFFNSGYMANLAIYATLFDKASTIFADKSIHASIIDGIKLSQAKLKRYKHQDLQHLAEIYDKSSFVTTEGLFSSSGKISQLSLIAKIAPKSLIVDEAHSFGVLGDKGKGAISKYNLSHKDIPIAIFPLGKAFGAVGAVVCCTNELAKYLVQFARNYIYSTALPPLIINTLVLQLQNLANASDKRQKLFENINYFNKLCRQKNLQLVTDDISPIKSIVIGDNALAIKLKKNLSEKNILVSCFRYPSVPKNQALLRFSLHASNTFEQINQAINIIAYKGDTL